MKYYHHDHHGDHCGCGSHEQDHEHEHCHDHGYHHHDEPARDAASLGELAKARILLAHMLDHNQHHIEEMKALAARFADAGDAVTAKKVREARARMAEANLALMEAVSLADPKEEGAKTDAEAAPQEV